MRILFRHPDPPLLHRELPYFGLDRVLFYLVIPQFLMKCLYYQNNASRGKFIDFCN